MIEKSLEKFIDEIGYEMGCAFKQHSDSLNAFDEEQNSDSSLKEYDETIKVVYEDNFKGWYSCARRPYYRMRGKSVSPEQAFDIIRRTDRSFDMMQSKDGHYIELDKYVGSYHLQNRWWIDNISPRFMCWCKPDGTIGYNDIMGKYPDLDEPLEELLNLLKAFPYLDFVWAITSWNELPTEIWDNLLESDGLYESDEYKCEKFTGFEDAIDILFWVHDQKVEILQGEKAVKLYKEYDDKYGQDPYRFTQDYWDDKCKETGELPVSLEYLDRCLDAYGLKRENLQFLYSIVR